MPPPKPRTEKKICYWVWGDAGTGKSRAARVGDHYIKLGTKWWDGYTGQKRVVIDDLGRDAGKALFDKLKLWADPWYDQPGETKGGCIALTYDQLIVTANWHPRDMWAGVDLDTIMRRFEFTDELKAEKKSDEENLITLDDVRNLNNKLGF